MIDSDYDEDDEYNQYEIDEIFSVSPTGTGDDDNDGCCGYDINREDYEGEHHDSEFDHDDIITPGGGAIGSIHSTPADDYDEDDCSDSKASPDNLNDLRVKRHMVKFGMHGNNSKSYEEYFLKHNAQGKLLENMNSKVFERLMSQKNQENYLNELKEMNTCPECIRARTNSTIDCKLHGHHHNFTKVLAATLGQPQSNKTGQRARRGNKVTAS